MGVVPEKKKNVFRETNVNIQIVIVIGMRLKLKADVLFKWVKKHKYFKLV